MSKNSSHPSPENCVALLGALCLFLAALEFLFPKPLPYIRLGLANIPLLVALRIFSARQLLTLAFLKVCGQAILHGTLGSYVFLFSLGGSLASVLTMLALNQMFRQYITLVGIGTLSALASNIAQAALSIIFIFGYQALTILPLFLGIGLIGGIVVGVLAELCWQRSRFVMALRTALL